jgi:hypothetical protein
MPRQRVEVSRYTGADYEYDYLQINRLDEQVIEKYCNSLRQRLRTVPRTTQEAEIWVARTYIAVKYLLSASLMLSSEEFAAERNLRIVEPYLLYYALFNASRAFLLMLPEQAWKDGRILEDVTHQKAQNVVADQLRYLSPEMAQKFLEINRRAMATREMLSYRFPALGLKGHLAKVAPDDGDVLDVCQFLADAAQLHSECIQVAFSTMPRCALSNTSETLKRFFEYEHKFIEKPFHDSDDWYRLWQFTRHSDRPLSLHLTGRPGLVEDFFGAWTPDENKQSNHEQYDPDNTEMRMIFDFN